MTSNLDDRPTDLHDALRALALRLADALDTGANLTSVCTALRAQATASGDGVDPDLVTDVLVGAHSLLAGVPVETAALVAVWSPTPVLPAIASCTDWLEREGG